MVTREQLPLRVPLRAGEVGPDVAARPRPVIPPLRLGATGPELPAHDVHLLRADGWICLPDWPPLRYFHPDPFAPSPSTTFVSGYRNVTGLEESVAGQARAQYPAPFLWLDPRRDAAGLRVAVTGREPRVHAIHTPGPGTHLYRVDPADAGPLDAATVGVVAVRPLQDGDPTLYRSGRYAYDDGDGSTGYDREFFLVLSEIWAEGQWCQARSRLPDRRNQRVDFALLNGRAWPDTLVPSGPLDTFHPEADASGRPIAPGGNLRLRYQPYSSLVGCNAGERVLLRLANLGRRGALMRLDGARMRVVGRGGAHLRGPDAGAEACAVQVGAGERVDVLFTAPPHGGGDGPDRHALWNCLAGADERGAGGQRTEVRVHPAGGPGALPPQALPHG